MSARLPASTQPNVCPLCGGGNDCAMTRSDGNRSECWCMSVKIGPEILAKVPEASRGVACICARCTTRYGATRASDGD